MQTVNRQWVLTRHPEGLVGSEHFELQHVPIPRPEPGEVLVRTQFLSCDPTQRGWLNGTRTYVAPVEIGEVMPSWGAGQVVESLRPEFRAGDRVWGKLRWQDYGLVRQSRPDRPLELEKVPEGVPLTSPLGVTGITGITAYIGMLDCAKPLAGDTVVVSAAAGATGSVAAQLAKLHGCRVIGIAGGPEKCRWLRDEVRLDAVIDYKHEDVKTRLIELCPKGVNVFFDNVGGALLDLMLFFMARFGRIVMSGMISHGHGSAPTPPLHNTSLLMFRSITLIGLLSQDHRERHAAASEQLLAWVREGKLVAREDIVEGLENAPLALRRLFEGANMGKQLVKVADPQDFREIER